MTLNSTAAAALVSEMDAELCEQHIARLETEPFSEAEISWAFGGDEAFDA